MMTSFESNIAVDHLNPYHPLSPFLPPFRFVLRTFPNSAAISISCHTLASSTGLLLKTKGLKVTAIKVDPYMNIDAGTMAPTEHG
jgi:hypothetical protein